MTAQLADTGLDAGSPSIRPFRLDVLMETLDHTRCRSADSLSSIGMDETSNSPRASSESLPQVGFHDGPRRFPDA